MQGAFEKARRAAEARGLRSGKSWQNLREVEQRAERLRQFAIERFKAEFDDRILKEVKRQIYDRYRKQRDYKPINVSDSNDIQRQADKNVQFRHEQRLLRSDRAEDKERNQIRTEARETLGEGQDFARPAPGREGLNLQREFTRTR